MSMKKFTGFVCALFIAQLSFGQITLKHSYKSFVDPVYEHYGDKMAFKYISYDKDGQNVIISNLDHSVYKTVELNLSGEENITIYSLYTNIVNSDPLIEFYYSANEGSKTNIYIMNEDGKLIKTLENAFTLNVVPTIDGFVITTYNLSPHGGDVYSLPTNLNEISSVEVENANNPYPNPANQQINIPYNLSEKSGVIYIYSSTGQLVEQKNLSNNFDNLLLNVSCYSKGAYYYQVDNQKGKFIVK